ncbi:SRPBCC family protein [Serinibacter salmoneus]|uniref:Polyketide cyclase/dehydrase/lipid transport protein n=1 Tax=Serinibacter salmoneus TaxID=556530 RepID=A0A2A9D075_9MICO|nr:SRPBCC family protein [Serinibacter salmoneus]PFG19250.1 hypothetical protein ATL40_0808 [Serinibacter salmoneus]
MPEVSRTIPASAQRTFALLADVERHDRWIPLTTITRPPGEAGTPLRPGSRFLADTAGILPDRMVVTRAHDGAAHPGEPLALHLRKLGPLLVGETWIRVQPTSPEATTCVATWGYRVGIAVGHRVIARRATTVGCLAMARMVLWRAGLA